MMSVLGCQEQTMLVVAESQEGQHGRARDFRTMQNSKTYGLFIPGIFLLIFSDCG